VNVVSQFRLGECLVIRQSFWKNIGALLVLLGLTIPSCPAQSFTKLLDFEGPNGADPSYGQLAQARDGHIYGTAGGGGKDEGGTVFALTPQGKLTTLYNFCAQRYCPDGSGANQGLVLAIDGNFYGTTNYGGIDTCGAGCGTIFKVTPRGDLTTLYSFCPQRFCADGQQPVAGLVQAADGNFYGTTFYGGSFGSKGVVFKIATDGTFATLHSFNIVDGCYPASSLIQLTDGNLYGTTESCGAYGYGTIFKITPEGHLTTLYNFCAQPNCTDGIYPVAGLVQAADGNLYGTTFNGGASSYGTIFRMTSRGILTTLYDFCSQPNCADGGWPPSALIEGTDHALYGTTFNGGDPSCNCGTLFRFSADGTFTTLHSFDWNDGAYPVNGLLQSTSGSFYGTSFAGGDLNCGGFGDGCGTLFGLDMGLAPFVTFIRSFGRPGQIAGILGQGFTGASAVSFDGTFAKFKVRSDTFLAATVPLGATTGYVTVTTPTGTLTSNKKFVVLP